MTRPAQEFADTYGDLVGILFEASNVLLTQDGQPLSTELRPILAAWLEREGALAIESWHRLAELGVPAEVRQQLALDSPGALLALGVAEQIR